MIESELFGEDYAEYQEILQVMERLCEQAKRLTSRVRLRNRKSRADVGSKENFDFAEPHP